MTSAVFADADAAVVGSILVLVGTLAGLWAQNRRTHRENRADHADVSLKVDELLHKQASIGADVLDVKADLRDHSARLRTIEATTLKPTPRKKV